MKKQKLIIIILTVLVVIGFGLTAYFAIQNNKIKKQFTNIGPKEKLEKIHSYVLVLEKFENFKRKQGQENTTEQLEKAVLDTESGVLKALYNDVVLGGNLEKDLNYFMDALIDSLEFFSRYK